MVSANESPRADDFGQVGRLTAFWATVAAVSLAAGGWLALS